VQYRDSKPPGPSAYTTEIELDHAGQRLDNFLLRVLKGVPRTHVYRLIRSGQVRVNSGRVRASYRLKAGDNVRVPPVTQRARPKPELAQHGLQWLEDRVLFEDNRIIVLNKPAGMAVHSGSGVSLGCIEALRCLRPKAPDMDLVHRLDRGTSGCLLIAKRRSALRSLHALLRDGGMEKRYLALLDGVWAHGTFAVKQPLAKRHSSTGTIVRVAADGKVAQSEFRVVEFCGQAATLVEIRIPTGRTHQIRVHAAHMGHAVAGDPRYGNFEFNERMRTLGLNRMFLHAHALEFTWPDSDETFMVSAPLPDELREAQARIVASGSRSSSKKT
jgi:23S rRNA pseudouridine955/2504/2580 synthase